MVFLSKEKLFGSGSTQRLEVESEADFKISFIVGVAGVVLPHNETEARTLVLISQHTAVFQGTAVVSQILPVINAERPVSGQHGIEGQVKFFTFTSVVQRRCVVCLKIYVADICIQDWRTDAGRKFAI